MVKDFDSVILLAHGARDERWIQPFLRIRDQVSDRLSSMMVRLAFMEFAAPTLADAAADLARAHKQSVLVVPIFLSGGGHVANDVPALIQPEAGRYPHIRFSVSGALGEEPEVVSAMSNAIVRLAGESPDQT
jgi:sirohydrochlorin cobaltochelatase